MTGLTFALGIAVMGGLGAAARYLVDRSVPADMRKRFPFGILIVNLSGSFVLGLITGLALDEPVAGILATGFLGGYTTFSTASFDTVRLIAERRTFAALANGPGVLIAGVALSVLGIVVTRW